MKTKSTKKIFISRALEPDSPFHHLRSQGHEVIAQSLVDIKYLDFSVAEDYDAVFFYSQKAIKHFFSKVGYKESVQYGVMGSGSQAVFKKETGHAPQIGSGSSEEIASGMNKLWANKTILFPLAKQSLRSLHSQLQSTKVIDLIIYDNQPLKNVAIPNCDLYLLTSPMNAKVFLESHKTDSDKIYAIGATTARQVKVLNGMTVLYCNEPSIENLYQLTKTKL